jgi:prepilin-type N-terminal cleavage/methylation domain-containing protein/prepilin-type processing-associated H-X9-DG protein
VRCGVYQSMGPGTWKHRAFTLLELVVVMGILALLTAMFLPAIRSFDRRSDLLECTQNLKVLNQAMIAYALDHGGHFPTPVTAPSPGAYWYRKRQTGTYLPMDAREEVTAELAACPNDPDARRSYAINHWATGAKMPPHLPKYGSMFRLSVTDSSRMILMSEAFSGTGSLAAGWVARDSLGFRGTPGQRFGGGGGLAPPISIGRFTGLNSELPFMRHRRAEDGGIGVQAIGRVNLAYVDGHVALVRHSELADFETGELTGHSYWSPYDKTPAAAAAMAGVAP